MFVLQAVCIQPISTRWNPSDSPTRNVDLVPPVPFSICLDLPFESLLALAPASGLRRFLSNWARLALLLVGGKLSAWTWTDSGRFAHYAKSSYPYGWASRSPPSSIDFDKTLGFPGEGPIWIWFIFVFSFGPPGSSLYSFACARHCPGCSLSFAHSVTSRSCHVAAMPLVDSHGQLEPRDRGDVRRAAERASLMLTDGRPVQPKTRDNREVLLQKFDTWLRASGDSLGSLIDAPSPDVDRINTLLELYGRELFRAGRPYNHYAETLNGISSRRPRLRRSLQQAWNLAVSWLREEPGSHHVALPWQCLVALVTTSWMWGWIHPGTVLGWCDSDWRGGYRST